MVERMQEDTSLREMVSLEIDRKILQCVKDNNERLHQSQLAQKLGLDRNTVSTHVRILEAKGLLIRRDDGANKKLCITDDGDEALSRFALAT